VQLDVLLAELSCDGLDLIEKRNVTVT